MAIPAHDYPHRSLAFRGDLNPFSGLVLALVGLFAISAAIVAADVAERVTVPAARRDVAPVIAGPRIDRHGAWERIEVEPAVAVEDLKSTSFGLVAAAGPDGVWISDKGLHWEQSLANVNAPVPGSGGGQVGNSAAPSEPSVLGAVKAVVEFDNALYVFGQVSSESRAWLVGWRSIDGTTWDPFFVANGWDQIMDATTGSEGITLFVRARRDAAAGGECCVAALYRSRDGEHWENLTDVLVGLENVQLWAATSLRGGYLAIGSSRRGDAVFSSDDGITWQETAGWQDAAPPLWVTLDLHRSAWSIVDLFEGPDGAMAVLQSERRRGIVLLTSADGADFNVIDESHYLPEFEDKRANDWPPLTAPEGAIHDGQVVLLGEWYPQSSDTRCTHLWRWTPPPPEDPPSPNRNR